MKIQSHKQDFIWPSRVNWYCKRITWLSCVIETRLLLTFCTKLRKMGWVCSIVFTWHAQGTWFDFQYHRKGEKIDFIEGAVASLCNFCCFVDETAIASMFIAMVVIILAIKPFMVFVLSFVLERRLKTKYTAMFPRESIIAESKHTTSGRGRVLYPFPC